MRAGRAVLLVSNHGDIVGGGELSFLGLVEGLDRSRWSPRVAVPAEGRVAERCRALGVPTHVVPLPSLRRPGPALIGGVRALGRLVREHAVGLVHANGSRAMFYAGVAGRIARRPVVWHLRIADRDPALDWLLFALARAVIVNSEAVGCRLARGDVRKVRRIYNGVDVRRFSPHPPPAGLRDSFGVPPRAPIVVGVGRFVAFKGFGDLLDAAAVVRQARPDVHWLLVGDGELRAEIERRCERLGLQAHVRFPGWRDDVADLLALCDVFALPSHGEHFGRVLIEAMAVARPVVATNAGGVPEIVVHGETGLLVPPGAPSLLAEAVLQVLAEPALAERLGRAGRRRVEAEFSLERHVAAVEALYADLLAG